MLKYRPTQPASKILLSSDPHYFHDKPWIVQDRGFLTQDEHAEYLLTEWGKIPEDHLLVILGDIFLTCPDEKAIEFMENLKCQVVMCWGNHNAHIKQWYDESLPEGFEDKVVYPLELKRFPNVTMMGDAFVLDISKREKYWCSHYAYMTWDKMHLKELCPTLCGHSHSGLDGAQPNDKHQGKLLDVGVDNSMKWGDQSYFTLDDVRNIMSEKPLVNRDHH